MKKTRKSEKSDFAKNIVSKRSAMGLSAEKLAEKAGVPYPTLRDIEAGYNAGREVTKIKIAKALGCSLSELYIGPGSTRIPDLTYAADFLSKFANLSPAFQGIVLAVVFEDESYLRETPPETTVPLLKSLRAL